MSKSDRRPKSDPLPTRGIYLRLACRKNDRVPVLVSGRRNMKIRAFVLILAAAGSMLAQTPGPGSVQSNGSATIPVKPDQAQLIVSVVTQSATAQDAGQQNATLATTVIAALNSVIGVNGTVQTIGYSVYPRYNSSSMIVGY